MAGRLREQARWAAVLRAEMAAMVSRLPHLSTAVAVGERSKDEYKERFSYFVGIYHNVEKES